MKVNKNYAYDMLDYDFLREAFVIRGEWGCVRNANFLNGLEQDVSKFEKLRKFYCITAYEEIYKKIKNLIEGETLQSRQT